MVIVADDLGYGDLPSYGNDDGILTPTIDELAARGTRFTSAYATAPVCAPSRVGILTGQHQQRFGFEFNTDDEGAPGRGLASGVPTLASALRAAGYATGIVGKWHLGEDPEFRPLVRGFDEYFGFLSGGRPYFPDPRIPSSLNLDRDDRLASEPLEGYLTDALAEEAVAFIARHRTEPFFLYLAPTAPHVPLEAAVEDEARFPSSLDPQRRTYYAMIAALDDLVAAVLAALRASSLETSTYVFFVSDNGGATFRVPGVPDNGGFALGKGVLFEGGIRVPFIVSGPDVVSSVSEPPISTLDLAPTLLELSGISLPPTVALDGQSLVSRLRGTTASETRDLFFRLGPSRAVRRDRWKLIQSRLRDGSVSTWLFDLAADPGETTDLSSSHPAVVTSLSDALDAWDATLEAPLWPGQVPSDSPALGIEDGEILIDGRRYRVEF